MSNEITLDEIKEVYPRSVEAKRLSADEEVQDVFLLTYQALYKILNGIPIDLPGLPIKLVYTDQELLTIEEAVARLRHKPRLERRRHLEDDPDFD